MLPIRPREVLAARRLDHVAVPENVHPGAFARAVVRDHDVRPLAGRQAPEVAGRDARRRPPFAVRVRPTRHPERELPRSDVHQPAAIGVIGVVLPRDDIVAFQLGLVDPQGDREGRIGVERHGREARPRCVIEAERRQAVRPGFNLRPALESDGMPLPFHLEGRIRRLVEVEPHPLRLVLQGRLQVPVVARREPLGEGGIDLRRPAGHPRLHVGGLLPQVVPELPVRFLRDDQDGRRVGDVAVHYVLRSVPEERGHRVELALADRVELVVVAGGATDGQTQKDVADRLRAILRVDGLVLLGNDPALVGGDVVALEAGRHELVQARLGQQIAGHLLHRELVEGLVPVEGADDPVAVGIHLAVVVDVNPVRVAIARRVEPVAGPVLAPLLGREQPVDVPLVGVLRRIVQECMQQRGIGRQPRQVERRAARQRPPVGLGRRRQPLGLQPGEDEAIERIARPVGVGHGRSIGTDDRLERPVLVPGSALVDPAPQHVDLLVVQRLVGVGRRHPQPRVGVRDALEDKAGPGVPLDDRVAVRPFRESALLGVEPQPHLPRALVRPMALEAVVRQDRPHLPLEVDGRRRSRVLPGRRRYAGERPRREHQDRRRERPQATG